MAEGLVMRRMRRGWSVGLLSPALLACGLLWGETPASSPNLCNSSEILSSPSRPNLASSADVTECGLLEFEQGWTRVTEPNAYHEDSLNSMLRYGLGHNLDVRWSADLMALHSEPGEYYTGVGDTSIAVRYRFWKQSSQRPAMAVEYGTKLPSAGSYLGTGFTDHNLGLLASKDLGRVKVDYNLVHAWLGSAQGYGPYTYMVMALSSTLRGPLGAIVEFSGGVQPVGCAGTTLALTYRLNRRVTVDAGATVALGAGGVPRRMLLGFTYAIWKHARPEPVTREMTGAG